MDIIVRLSLLACVQISGMPACVVWGCQFDGQRLAKHCAALGVIYTELTHNELIL